jgi:predicted naringenin-chalcone synthase
LSLLLSLERFVPPHRYTQAEVVPWVRRWLEPLPPHARERLLGVYDTAGVARRGSVLPIEEVFRPDGFEAKNDAYIEAACAAGTELARDALGKAGLAPQDVSLVVSVSCTGFMIPAVDAYVANALGLGPRLARLPITESGCAGGVVGLARACDYLAAHPERAALLLALEFSSLTLQHWDRSPANVVSAAIFGDGGAACVLVGREHPLAKRRPLLRALASESVFFPRSTHLMGFKLRNQGLQIVLDKGLSPFVKQVAAKTIDGFLAQHGLSRGDLRHFVLHPGGRRIIEVMAAELGLDGKALAATSAVLAEHGNMSSVTVLFVLEELLRTRGPGPGERGLVGAFGPGFGAELLLVEFC